MNNIDRRLAKLEADLARRPTGDRAGLQDAMRRLFDAIEQQYPDAGYQHTSAAAGSSIVRLDSMHQVQDAATRLSSGATSHLDMAALTELPADALKTFGWSAEEFLTLVGALRDPGTSATRWPGRACPRERR